MPLQLQITWGVLVIVFNMSQFPPNDPSNPFNDPNHYSNNNPFAGGSGPNPNYPNNPNYYQSPPPYTTGFNPLFSPQQEVPNAVAVLVLGIASLLGGLCYGVIGLILGIVALAIAANAKRIYNENPQTYTSSSYSSLNAGRICAIIGLCLAGCWLIILIFYIFIVASFVSAFN
jgi:M penetrans paralogue family 26